MCVSMNLGEIVSVSITVSALIAVMYMYMWHARQDIRCCLVLLLLRTCVGYVISYIFQQNYSETGTLIVS